MADSIQLQSLEESLARMFEKELDKLHTIIAELESNISTTMSEVEKLKAAANRGNTPYDW
jgi:hypothetical protein